MFYEDLCQDSAQDFKRATGVSKDLFAEMLLTLEQAQSRMGRSAKLTLSNQLLLTLMYLREYRTQFHSLGQSGTYRACPLGKTYRVSEPTVCRIVTRIENTLMASGQYTLPGKHVLSESGGAYELILVDATETHCERPKKSGPAREADSPDRWRSVQDVLPLGQDTKAVLQREKEAGRPGRCRFAQEAPHP